MTLNLRNQIIGQRLPRQRSPGLENPVKVIRDIPQLNHFRHAINPLHVHHMSSWGVGDKRSLISRTPSKRRARGGWRLSPMHVLVSDTSVPVDLERGSFLDISFRRSGAFHLCRNTEPQTQLPENSVQCGEPRAALGTLLNCWNYFDRPLLNCLCSITAPTRSLQVIPVIQQRPLLPRTNCREDGNRGAQASKPAGIRREVAACGAAHYN